MKSIILSIALFSILVGNLSCSEENKVTAWIADGEELDEGTSVFFSLKENYPNPFNPSTTIGFDLAIEKHVDLEVYSDNWIKMATLINTEFAAGRYQVTFNAAGLSSGEYFYTMTVEGVTQIRKMKFMK